MVVHEVQEFKVFRCVNLANWKSILGFIRFCHQMMMRKLSHYSQAWWWTPLISALGEATAGIFLNLRPAWSMEFQKPRLQRVALFQEWKGKKNESLCAKHLLLYYQISQWKPRLEEKKLIYPYQPGRPYLDNCSSKIKLKLKFSKIRERSSISLLNLSSKECLTVLKSSSS